MNKLAKGAAAAVAAASILLNAALPVLAQTTIELSGNGADSTNVADVQQVNATMVVQNNTADISNNVDADADTGNNDANRNTGGDVSVDTGDASTTVGISNTLNSNEAEVGCCTGDTDVLISGNGSDSMNKVELENRNMKRLFQGNRARIKNYVNADSDTGNNDANRNTGGDVDVQTGDADVQVAIVNEANSNSARIGGDGNGGGSVSARILGNGESSHNHIDLEIVSMTLVNQLNTLRLSNKVNADADTGNNDANRNTGGSVSVDTGDASTTVGIDNMANFNFADLDCGCLLDVLAKIAGNGSDSRNRIHAHINDVREIFQENVWMCGGRRSHHGRPCNDVDADADTGGNDANRNTGDPDGDPSVETGNADTDVLIENAGNVNSVGADGPGFDFDFPGGFSFNLNLSFSLSNLLALLGLV